MSPTDSQLLDVVQRQSETNAKVAEAIGRFDQALVDMRLHLLGGEGQVGALPYFVQQFEKHKAEDDKRFEKLEKPVDSLLRTRLAAKKWVAGVIAVLTLEGVLLAFYFEHLAAPLHELIKHK